MNLHKKRLVGGTVSLEDIPSELDGCIFWQFGNGEHASPRRRIIGSVVLNIVTDSMNRITIRHLVIEGSSQWILGRNITLLCNIIHLGRHALQMPCGESEYISLIDFDRHSHVPIDRFIPHNSSVDIMSECSSNTGSTGYFASLTLESTSDMETPPLSSPFRKPLLSSWDSVKSLVNRVHRHVYGHATFSDMRTLFIRNRLWTNEVQHYLS